MEGSEGDENESGSVWKQFQAKAKPLLSPKLGGREPDEQSKRSMWMFKKTKRKKNVALDRVISSSQPDLVFSAEVTDVKPQEAPLCSKPPGSSSLLGREKLHSSIKRKSTGASKSTVAQLVQSHHKSSSLGSACLERLTEPPGGSRGGDAATAQAAAVESHPERKHELAVSRGGPVRIICLILLEVLLNDV
uniref:Uncharacterized protein n=1 Tax=Poecilia latipinna TaxID=48699 RepID=A0A3B3V7Q8_9TELE